MSIKPFILAIHKLYPNVDYTVGYDAFDINKNKVEYDENLVNAEIAKTEYIEKREREYPSVTDYLDGVVKGNQTQIDKYIADCLAVKAKYPKPE
jgi:hypothetical protein